jgi:Oligosaccharyl transferase STT3 subunit
MRAPTPILLLALAALALLLRWAPAAEYQLASDERDLAPSRWLIDDPATAYHARRIELALAGDRAPQFDRFLNHPEGSEIPWSPLYDTAIAAAAQRGLRESGADPALGGIEEARLESFLMRVPPLFGALITVATFWGVLLIATGKRRALCAFLAALAVSVAPVGVVQSAAGHLDHLSWIALLVAVQIGVSVAALRSEEPLATVFGALVTGIVAGLELTSFTLGLALFFANWIGYLVLARAGDAEKKRLGQRAGLLFCAVAAFVGRLTLSEGPWEGARESVMGAWCESTCAVALLCSIPFIIGFLRSDRRSNRIIRSAMFVIALCVLLYNAPTMLHGLSRGWSWYRQNRALLVLVSPEHRSPAAEPGRFAWLLALTPVCVAFVPAWLLLLRRWREPDLAFLVALSAITGLFFLCERRLGGVFLVPMACVLGAALDLVLREGSERARRIAWSIAGASLAVFAAHAVAAELAEHDSARREERIEFVKGLRWMRENTPSPGAWNTATGPNDWGVITSFSAAHLVEYHARRPAVVSDLALISGGEVLSEVSRALLDEKPATLLRCLRSSRSRYVVVGPRLLRDVPALERLANAGDHGIPRATIPSTETTMLARLSLTGEAADADVAGLERVYASARRVNVDGHAPEPGQSFGPAISIYRLSDPALGTPTPEFKAR